LIAASVPYLAKMSFFLIVDYYCGPLSDPSSVAEAFKNTLSNFFLCQMRKWNFLSNIVRTAEESTTVHKRDLGSV
jgi:hypothetical protein